MATIVPASIELVSVGDIEPGGVMQIVSNSLASPTVVTTARPHGLRTGDKVFWTASTTSSPLLTATPKNTVTVLTPTTFSLDGINCSVAGTAGAYDYPIESIPTTAAGVAAVVNCGRPHGLRVGDSVTIVASGSTPSCDGAQTVTAIPSATSFTIGAITNITVAGSTTTGHYSKTTFYSDVIDRQKRSGGGALVVTSLIGTAPNTVAVDIQGSVDGVNWFNIPYALQGTPRTFVVTQITITTSTTSTYLLQEQVYWRYLRLKMSSSTNIKLSFTATVQ